MSSSSSSSSMPRLGPAWRNASGGGSASGSGGVGGGTAGSSQRPRGFQPPPAVPDASNPPPTSMSRVTRDRSGSHASGGSASAGGGGSERPSSAGVVDKNRNPFAMLDTEGDDDGGGGGGTVIPTTASGSSAGGGRFDSLRSGGGGGGGAGGDRHNNPTHPPPPSAYRAPGTKGRSLADLLSSSSSNTNAASAATPGSPHRHHWDNHRGGGGGVKVDRRGPPGPPAGFGSAAPPAAMTTRTTADHPVVRGGRDDHHRPVVRGGGRGETNNHAGAAEEVDVDDDVVDCTNKAVLRYTREKLLSLRGRGGDDNDGPPACLVDLEDDVVVSKTSQDPVCWDTFDADEIWAHVVSHTGRDRPGGIERGGGGGERHGPASFDHIERKGSSGMGGGVERGGRGRMLRDLDSGDSGRIDHRGGGGFDSGRWQRGVALPDSDVRSNSRGRSDSNGGARGGSCEADDPNDLWDDPTAPSSYGAASDFSAFGGSLDDDRPSVSRAGSGRSMETFDLSDISKAAAAFDSELHAEPSSAGGIADDGGVVDDDDTTSHVVDASRPLATTGTTIRSGSGDNVNVFEDFGDVPVVGFEDDAAPGEEEEEELPIKSGNVEHNASSLLMRMIGVSGTGEVSGGVVEPEPSSSAATDATETKSVKPGPDEGGSKPAIDNVPPVPSNPWGAPASLLSINPWGDAFGKQAKEDEAAASFAAQQKLQEEELLRQRQRLQKQQQLEDEEKKRWEAVKAKQESEMRAAQQEQLERMKQQQNQVELVLIERISSILENSWGRSDLTSILSTMHANDSRTIAILSTVEALRSLIARHPLRIQLGRDHTMGAEMAALRLTNAQWQVHQARVQAQLVAAQQLQLAQEQELQRRRQLQVEQARQQRANTLALAEEHKKQFVVTDAPWFYADPQGNIQGPFGGNEMRQWLEAGYFKGDLPISQSRGGPFHALNSFFSDASMAFYPTIPSVGEDVIAAEANALAEAEALAARAEVEAKSRAEAIAAAEKASRAAKAEMEAKAHAEAEVKARAEADAANKSDQSSQLKMMLGLGKGSSGVGGMIAGPPPPKSVPEAAVVDVKKKSKKTQQKHEQPVLGSEIPATPAWGVVATAGPNIGRKKSMSEIQQEEAREAARRAKEQGYTGNGGSQQSGGWANVAASGGSTAWKGAAVVTPAAVVVAPTPTVVVAGLGATAPANAAWIKPTTTTSTPQLTAPAPTAKKPSSKKVAAVDNSFGMNGCMAPSLESWCKEQMEKLNGTDDLTLIQFCMTLTDRDEIRQYLAAYLGSTPQVNNFATEFIRRKWGDTNKQEEWESAGGKKNARKKKGGK